MRSFSDRNRSHAGQAMFLTLGLGLGLQMVYPAGARAARLVSKVTPAPSSSSQSTPVGTTLAQLAGQVAASRSSTASNASSTSLTPVPTTVSVSDPLSPSSLLEPITNSKFLKDFGNLFAIKSGKLVNWNQQTLNTLASDLGIRSSSHAAASVTKTTPVLAAQEIDGAPAVSAATIQPAPVPEPGTLLVFITALGGLLLRGRLGRDHPSA